MLHVLCYEDGTPYNPGADKAHSKPPVLVYECKFSAGQYAILVTGNLAPPLAEKYAT